jgi:hypothetical protein
VGARAYADQRSQHRGRRPRWLAVGEQNVSLCSWALDRVYKNRQHSGGQALNAFRWPRLLAHDAPATRRSDWLMVVGSDANCGGSLYRRPHELVELI